MSAIWIAVAVINATGWLLPDPADKFGWGLRVRTLELHQPFLTGESLERTDRSAVMVVLINQTSDVREYVALESAFAAHDLRVSLLRPNGKPLLPQNTADRIAELDQRLKLHAGPPVVPLSGSTYSSTRAFRNRASTNCVRP